MGKPLVIGICGGSGSGKTTLALKLTEMLGDGNSALLFQDSYYKDLSHLAESERKMVNFDHPAAIDWELFESHIGCLLDRQSIKIPVYDYVTHSRASGLLIDPAETIVIEGHLIFSHDAIRRLIDIRLFIDIEIDMMLIRRLKRDISERGRSVQSVLDQYTSTVKPMYVEYVAPSKKWADIVVSSEDFEGTVEHIVNDAAALRRDLNTISE